MGIHGTSYRSWQSLVLTSSYTEKSNHNYFRKMNELAPLFREDMYSTRAIKPIQVNEESISRLLRLKPVSLLPLNKSTISILDCLVYLFLVDYKSPARIRLFVDRQVKNTVSSWLKRQYRELSESGYITQKDYSKTKDIKDKIHRKIVHKSGGRKEYPPCSGLCTKHTGRMLERTVTFSLDRIGITKARDRHYPFIDIIDMSRAKKESQQTIKNRLERDLEKRMRRGNSITIILT